MQKPTQTPSTLNPESLPRQPPSVKRVEQVFARLYGQLGAKVGELFKGVPPEMVKSEWALGLEDCRPEEIERGLAAVRGRPFAPVLGEFLRLCRPALDAETAWLEAVEGLRERLAGRTGSWSHPAIYRAAHVLSFELRTSAYAAQRKRWEWVLQRELAKGWGDDVSAPVPRLATPPVRCSGPSAEVRERIAAILDSYKRSAQEARPRP